MSCRRRPLTTDVAILCVSKVESQKKYTSVFLSVVEKSIDSLLVRYIVSVNFLVPGLP